MEVSGEVAELLIKEGLEVAETAAKLAGSGMKNVAALLAAIARESYQIKGKASAKQLAADPTPATVTPLRAEDLKQFQRLAKDFGLLYFIPQKRGEENTILNVVSNETHAAKLNAIYQAMGYPVPEKKENEGRAAKKAPARAPQEPSFNERGNGLTHSRQMEAIEPGKKPSVRKRLAALEAMVKQARSGAERAKNMER